MQIQVLMLDEWTDGGGAMARGAFLRQSQMIHKANPTLTHNKK